MSEESPIEMDEKQINTFLGNGGTGVISLTTSADEPPHAIPVSYGYDVSKTTFYFRLASSTKGDLDDRPVTFVTYGDDDGWKSVVARGRLEDVEKEGIATETLEGLDHVDIPLVDIFHSPLREVEFEFYRLVPDDLSGRVESKVSSR